MILAKAKKFSHKNIAKNKFISKYGLFKPQFFLRFHDLQTQRLVHT